MKIKIIYLVPLPPHFHITKLGRSFKNINKSLYLKVYIFLRSMWVDKSGLLVLLICLLMYLPTIPKMV